MPSSFLLLSFRWRSLGTRSPVAVTPRLVGRSSILSGMEPTLDGLRDDHISNHELPTPCACWLRTQGISGLFQSNAQTFLPMSSVGVCWLLLLVKTAQPKPDNLFIENFGFIPRISFAGDSFSCHLKTKFLILAVWRIASPYSILGSPKPVTTNLLLQVIPVTTNLLLQVPTKSLATTIDSKHLRQLVFCTISQ